MISGKGGKIHSKKSSLKILQKNGSWRGEDGETVLSNDWSENHGFHLKSHTMVIVKYQGSLPTLKFVFFMLLVLVDLQAFLPPHIQILHLQWGDISFRHFY